MKTGRRDAPLGRLPRLLTKEFTCVAHTTMNENICPQITQIDADFFFLCVSAPLREIIFSED